MCPRRGSSCDSDPVLFPSSEDTGLHKEIKLHLSSPPLPLFPISSLLSFSYPSSLPPLLLSFSPFLFYFFPPFLPVCLFPSQSVLVTEDSVGVLPTRQLSTTAVSGPNYVPWCRCLDSPVGVGSSRVSVTTS